MRKLFSFRLLARSLVNPFDALLFVFQNKLSLAPASCYQRQQKWKHENVISMIKTERKAGDLVVCWYSLASLGFEVQRLESSNLHHHQAAKDRLITPPSSEEGTTSLSFFLSLSNISLNEMHEVQHDTMWWKGIQLAEMQSLQRAPTVTQNAFKPFSIFSSWFINRLAHSTQLQPIRPLIIDELDNFYRS